MSFISKLKSFDIFGQDFSFNATKSTSKYQTNCGASLTLVCILVTMAAFLNFTSEYLSTDNPRVTISSERKNKYPDVNLVENEFLPSLGFVNVTRALPSTELDRFLTMVAVKIELKFNSGEVQGTYTPISTQNFVDCQNSKNSEYIAELAKQSGSYQMFKLGLINCPEDPTDTDFWSVRGVPNDLPFYYISYMVYPCSLPDPTQCATAEEVSKLEMTNSFASRFYKLSDKKNPVKLLFEYNRFTVALDPSRIGVSRMHFANVKIMDEDIDFKNAGLNKEFFKIGNIYTYSKARPASIHCTKLQIMTGVCIPYVETRIMSGSNEETVLRVYPKLFSTISELGGFGDLIFIAVGMIYFWYNNYYFNKQEEGEILREE